MSVVDVDPGLKTLLDQLAALGGPTLVEMTPDEARANYTLMAAMAGAPEEVGSAVDGTVAGVPVRTYRPAGADPAGTLAWFHGGGWVIGDVETADAGARKLANRSGCTVVSVDYRRAPEHPFPAPLDDCWAVVEALSADPSTGPLAVGGDSAGGNLAAVVARRARDRGVELCHQLLVYPVTDLATEHPSYADNAEGYLLTAASMRWFIAHYTAPQQRKDQDVSPLLADDLAGVAPAHVVTAGFDPLRDEGDAYAAALAGAGVNTVHDTHPTMVHGFFGLGMLTPVADEVIDRAGSLLAAAVAS